MTSVLEAEPRFEIRQLDSLELSTEARLVGLRNFSTPTLEAVERRRVQLWCLSIVILIGTSAVMLLASLWPNVLATVGVDVGWFTPVKLRAAMAALTLGFTVYTVEKERHLRKLTRLLIDERVLTAALSNRLSEVTALLEAGKAINSVLELDAVLDIILRSATSLLDADSGSVMLLAGDDVLRVVCTRGNGAALGAEVHVNEGIAGRVARSWEPMLVTGPATANGRTKGTESAMCVPLLHRGQLLGVLNVNGRGGRSFSEYDLRALSLFAEHAAAAIANARLYEIEKQHVAELVEGEMRKSQFLAAVSHDLRTPLTSLIGCTKMLQRKGISEQQRVELAEMVDRQSQRLNRMIEELLTAARLEAEAPPVNEPVDVGVIVHELAEEYRMAEWDVRADGPRHVAALGRDDALRRVVANLIDNALVHGRAPVRLGVHATAGLIEITVRDHGPGIPAEERERVFERFTRLDKNRQTPGIGLGLSIVQGLVVSCGGAIRIEDPDDAFGGVVFRVQLRAV